MTLAELNGMMHTCILALAMTACATNAEPDPLPDRTSGTFTVKAGLEQVYVRYLDEDLTGVPGTVIELVEADGDVLDQGEVDQWGGLVFRNVPPATGYSVRLAANPDDYTSPLEVRDLKTSLPPQSFYDNQVIQPGFGYLETRDGNKLSYFCTLPGPPENGPYPTVISYSGYAPSMPGKVVAEDVVPFCEIYPILCNAPDDPSNMIAALLGFATVGVNMRGTGCSDGAFDYFEPLQSTDGYDVVEIVAAQPWVKHHKVGMVGISYPGIASLFVAATRPPSLAAIAPQSVLADSTSSCLLPGGIYNDGFAKKWHDAVLNYAMPWDPWWTTAVHESGDPWCGIHQRLHGQQRDAITEALHQPYYTDEVARPVDPSAWVDQIDVPVFMTGQWQDEQTGPHFAALMDKFTSSPDVHFTVSNGFHNDSAAPQDLIEWMEFLYLFVAREIPKPDEGVLGLGGIFMEKIFGCHIDIRQTPLAKAATYEEALQMWRDRAPVRVIFDSGTNPKAGAAAPVGAFEQRFASWPIPETVVDRWTLGLNSTMTQAATDAEGVGPTAASRLPASGDSDVGEPWELYTGFVTDLEAGGRVTLASGEVYDSLPPDWSWRQPASGNAVDFITPPLTETRVMLGSGSVDLWVRSNHDDADLEVTLTEVRPDGMETYVQAGWLRVSQRAPRDDATELRPVKTHREADLQPLNPGEWVLARVEIMPFGHVFRAGSRIRLIVDTPGDSMASWMFNLKKWDDPNVIEIAVDETHPSSVALPLVPGIDVPTELPADCTALRGQPCRYFVPLSL